MGLDYIFISVCLSLSLPALHAQTCTGTIRGPWNQWNYIKAELSGFPPELQAIAETALNQAIMAWNSCGNGIPSLSTQAPSGGTYFYNFTFQYVTGTNPDPTIQRVCGRYQNIYLSNVYAFQKDGTQIKPCPLSDPQKLKHILAHEIGHRLGLSDYECENYIMTSIPSGADGATVQANECTAADALNKTAFERGVCDAPNDCRISPILLSCRRDPWDLTSVFGGVAFDYDGDGISTQTAWTKGPSHLGFLFTDLDGTGCVERGGELFGENRLIGEGRLAENGFEALDGYDSDRDGWITNQDSDWGLLRLWVDRSHDGLCTDDEVASLPEAQVLAIDLDYQTSEYVDQHGNAFRFYSESVCRQGQGSTARRPVWDVFFATAGTD